MGLGDAGGLVKDGKTIVKTATKTAKPSGRNGNVLPLGNHPGNSGGKPGRSGRKPSKWVEDCEKALNGANAPEVLKAIIAGDIQEHIADDRKTGEPIYGETRNVDRIGAIKFLASYVHGEPEQKVAATVVFKVQHE